MNRDITDEQLLTSGEPEAFGIFYARYRTRIERYFAARVSDREAAADLTAETFACALVAQRRFVPGTTPAVGWLYTIAARRLVDHQRRAAVDRRRRDSLVATERMSDDASSEPESEPYAPLELLRGLPDQQRDAVAAHIVRGRSYDEIAAQLGMPESAVRQRVSRGLRAMRLPLRVFRAARELAREDRAYRFAGGHDQPLAEIDRRAPLDCSSATSLILARAGAFPDDEAWSSTRLAGEWGQPGEGRQVTLWANEEHVWLELRLGRDHVERLDPTPARLAPHSGWMAPKRGPASDARPRHWPGH